MFENGKYIYPDTDLRNLRSYCEDLGATFSDSGDSLAEELGCSGVGDNEPVRNPVVRVIDEFVISSA